MGGSEVQGGTRRRWVVVVTLVVAMALVLALASGRAPSAAGASAVGEPTPWDGVNPFHCKIQDAGLGTTVPDPGADPYCVHFDKTDQNVTQLGMASFLLDEPARTAAAVPKCFYFQEDHWRGSVIQSDGATEIYEFIGHYFFNKATGDGGAWVTDFNVNGRTADPTEIPGFPPQYGQDFGPGTGGGITHDEIPADPSCVALAAKDPSAVYAQTGAAPRCVAGTGGVDRHGLGPVALGSGEQVVRSELGPPSTVKRGFLHYCVQGGGVLLVGQPGDRSGTLGSGGDAPTVLLATSSRGFTLAGRGRRVVRVGTPLRALRRAFTHARSFARIGRVRVWRVSHQIVVLTARGRVRYLAVYDPRALRGVGALLNHLRHAL